MYLNSCGNLGNINLTSFRSRIQSLQHTVVLVQYGGTATTPRGKVQNNTDTCVMPICFILFEFRDAWNGPKYKPGIMSCASRRISYLFLSLVFPLVLKRPKLPWTCVNHFHSLVPLMILESFIGGGRAPLHFGRPLGIQVDVLDELVAMGFMETAENSAAVYPKCSFAERRE